MIDRTNPFDVLGIPVGADEEDVKSAYERMRRIFGPDSMVAVGLYTKEYIEEWMQLVEEAFTSVASPDKRQAVLEKFKQTGTGESTESDVSKSVPERKDKQDLPSVEDLSVQIDEHTVFSGELLRQIRTEMGVELQAIAQTTKISTTNLALIEEERYSELPAPVYVRGFLAEYAKYLKLPHKQVVESYMKRMLEGNSDVSEGSGE